MVVITLDTNIYISGTFWLGSSKEIIHLAKKGMIKIIISIVKFKDIEFISPSKFLQYYKESRLS